MGQLKDGGLILEMTNKEICDKLRGPFRFNTQLCDMAANRIEELEKVIDDLIKLDDVRVSGGVIHTCGRSSFTHYYPYASAYIKELSQAHSAIIQEVENE